MDTSPWMAAGAQPVKAGDVERCPGARFAPVRLHFLLHVRATDVTVHEPRTRVSHNDTQRVSTSRSGLCYSNFSEMVRTAVLEAPRGMMKEEGAGPGLVSCVTYSTAFD